MEILEIIKSANQTELQFEELMFLHIIYHGQENPDDKDFIQNVKLYYERNQFYTSNIKENLYKWNNLIEKLVNLEYLEDYRNENEKHLKFSKLRVSEKFIDLFFTKADKLDIWEMFMDIWSTYSDYIELEVSNKNGIKTKKKVSCINNLNTPVLTPDSTGQFSTISGMIDYFWNKLCNNGNRASIKAVFDNTENYLKKQGANCKVSTFLRTYNSLFYDKFR